MLLLLAGCAGPSGDEPAPTDAPATLATVDAGDSVVLQGDGTWALRDGWAFRDWSRAFYAEHGDDYDFLAFFTDFDLGGVTQFAWATRIDVAGIGLAEQNEERYGDGLGADYTALAGSAGRLQAVLVMNSLDIADSWWLGAQDLVTHELGHRWGMGFRLPLSPEPTALFNNNGHWTPRLGQDAASALSYGQTTETAPGQFRSVRVEPLPYGSFDLYLMGLMELDTVGELFYVANPEVVAPPTGDLTEVRPGTPVDFVGERVDLAPTDVVAAMGPRDPPVAAAQKDFRMAFVLVCRPTEPCGPSMVERLEAERAAYPDTFAWATRGLGTMDTEL